MNGKALTCLYRFLVIFVTVRCDVFDPSWELEDTYKKRVLAKTVKLKTLSLHGKFRSSLGTRY